MQSDGAPVSEPAGGTCSNQPQQEFFWGSPFGEQAEGVLRGGEKPRGPGPRVRAGSETGAPTAWFRFRGDFAWHLAGKPAAQCKPPYRQY